MGAGEAEPFYYGGQAVLEGVMMRGRLGYAVAVRPPGGAIHVTQRLSVPWVRRAKALRWPLVRGAVAMAEALVIGYRALNESAARVMEDADPGGESTLARRVVELASPVLGAALAVALFVVLPAAVVRLAQGWVTQPALLNLIEGLVKAGIFIGYVGAIGLWPDMARVFAYHGAEHKAINCYEAGEELTVERVRRHSRLHPRCGTNFLLLVVLISVIVFSAVTGLTGRPTFVARVLIHLAILPLVAGVAYEVIRAAGRKEGPALARWAARPGMWLQYLTTREPDDSQLEVAIAALTAVLERDGVAVPAVRAEAGEGSPQGPAQSPLMVR